MTFLTGTIIFIVLILLAIVIEIVTRDKKYSEIIKVKGKVVDLSYSSEKSSNNISPVMVGGNIGFSYNSSHYDAEYNVIIKSKQLGKVIIDNEELYDHVDEGKEVIIAYKEEFFKRSWQDESKRKNIGYEIEYIEFKGEKFSN